MNKAKVGDRIKIVAAEQSCGEYHNGDTGVVEEVEENGVYTEFDHYDEDGTKIHFFVYHTEYEVVKSSNVAFSNQKNQHNSLKPSAEQIRENILSLRIERERLKVAISDIDKQEAEMLELLKEMGFVLHEEVVKTCGKTVLYAEDIEEDMNDPLNWKVGDRVKVAASVGSKYCEIGDVFEVSGVELGGWVRVQQDSAGLPNTIDPSILKFHSRPVNN